MQEENIILAPAGQRSQKIGWLQRLARERLIARLDGLRCGELELEDADGHYRFGPKTTDDDLHARVTVRDPQFYADVALGGSVGAGDSYIRGDWSCDDLTALTKILVRNRDLLDHVEGGLARVAHAARRVLHWLNRNHRTGSRRNIAAHYDIGNDLFRLFLDETMMYSCGIFLNEESSLLEASVAKIDIICRKLQLSPRDHVIEIGAGWGGFAIHAAAHYGCRVTTTTISTQQHELAKERIARSGLTDRITLLKEDYRDLSGSYDKLVSIEMIEAVGHEYYDTYFRQCSELLKPDGMMLLQAITIADQLYEAAKREVDFIKRYIFPGGCLPSISVMTDSIARASDLRLFHLDDIGPHYVTTLRRWRERFSTRLDEVRALGYSDDFIRMWEFYLCYSEGAFTERAISNVQMLLTKPLSRRETLATS